MKSEYVDTAYSLQLDFARATPLLPSLFPYPFSLLSLISQRAYFWRLSLRQESCKECAVSTSSQSIICIGNSSFLNLAPHYMRSEYSPKMSTHQTFHLILLSSNIKYMLLDNKFSKKAEDNNNLVAI